MQDAEKGLDETEILRKSIACVQDLLDSILSGKPAFPGGTSNVVDAINSVNNVSNVVESYIILINKEKEAEDGNPSVH